METMGIPVAALDSATFPQFFTKPKDTDVKTPLNLQSVQEVASVMRANQDLQVWVCFLID